MKHFVSFMRNSLPAFFLCLSFFVLSNSLNGNNLERPRIQGMSSDNSYYYYSLIPPISENSPTPDNCKCKFYQDAVNKEIQHYYRLCQGTSVIGDPYEKSGIFNQYETMELCNSGIDYEKKNESFKVLKASDTFKKPLPTNQWHSSLAWKIGLFSNTTRKSEDYFSSPMFALPLSYKTESEGLNLGYNDTAIVYKSSTYGYPRSYTFPHNSELIIGVGNGDMNETSLIKAFDSVLDNHSDWAVTALWRDESKNQIMSSTFAHGLPFTYFETPHDNAIIKVIPSNKLTYFTYTLENIDGDYIKDGKTEFYIPIKVPNKDFVAVSTNVKVTYDFNSQGQDLREEDYTQFNSAPSTNWEFYTTEEGAIQKITLLNNPSLSFQNLSKGKITLEIWVSNHGTNPNGYSVIDNSKAYLKVPFNVNPNNDNKLYLKPQSDNAYNSQLVKNLNSSQKNDSLKTKSFQVINNLNNGVLFTTGEHNYAAFGSVGTTWEVDNENWVLKSNLTGKGYFSIALLPDESSDSTKRDSLFQTFSQYASSFLKSDSGTQVSWQYDKGM